MTSPPVPIAGPHEARRPRDLRLDFFRGLAMFIILLAHVPGNTWTLWIPARFGFSDATEIFVFCSGMASALAFGAVFATRGFLLGTARIAFRVWQVYWAHVGVFLVTATMLFAIDHYDAGNRSHPYITEPWVVPLFERTGEALIGLLTLAYVPGLFDILPMYLVLLAMIPAVMLAQRAGGTPLAAALVVGVWLAANLAGWARSAGAGTADADGLLLATGRALSALNLSAWPFGDGQSHTWFFNPFAWQIVFFTGFAFGMGWLRPPPVTRGLVLAAAGYLLLCLPLAWFNLYGGSYIPQELTVLGWSPQAALQDLREASGPLWWKTWLGGARYLHFLAVAYLAWVAVGPGGERLATGFPALPLPGRLTLALAALAAVAFLPHALVHEIHVHAPALEAWLLSVDWLGLTHRGAAGEHLLAHPWRIGLWQLLFLVAVAILALGALGPGPRRWLAADGFLRTVPVIRKVGTQSLAVFMVSVPLSQAMGWAMDVLGRDILARGGVNFLGFAILIAVAYGVGWIKRQPWREAARSSPETGRGGAATAAPRPRGGPLPAQRP